MITFALSTIVVGITFYGLGRLDLGSAVLFFPKQVIVGCVGGIGVFVASTGLEVSTGIPVQMDGMSDYLSEDVRGRWILVLSLVALLRLISWALTRAGHSVPLLSPIFFLSITPCFFLALRILDVSVDAARDAGYFFPLVAAAAGSSSSSNTYDLFTTIRFGLCDWTAVEDCLPTIVGLTVFSVMHVPINIPSLALSTEVEVDMNKELISHGWSNLLTGCCGGLQNYLCYSNSFAYFKSGGGGRFSSLAIAATSLIFFYTGEEVTAIVPRAMAGCLLTNVGLDLFLEGVYDSYEVGGYDTFEYATIWLIVLTMTTSGMLAGLAIGALAAAVTFVVNTGIYTDPIRGIMSASTLRSSLFRSKAARAILASPKVYICIYIYVCICMYLYVYLCIYIYI
jgi:SulP family sulfate permease